MKAVLLLAVVAACYTPVTVRRESTHLNEDSGRLVAAAIAPEQGNPKRQQFDEHYQAALAFYERTQYPEAIAEFEAAYDLDPQPILVFNIGQAYRKAGKLDEALAKYHEYLEKDPAAERDRVNDIIREVERALGPRRPVSVRKL